MKILRLEKPLFVKLFIPIMLCVFMTSCHSKKESTIPELANPYQIVKAILHDIVETVPAYGVGVASVGAQKFSEEFEMNIESEDGALVQAGQSAVVFTPPNRESIPCRVSRIRRKVTAETGQALAWLKPLQSQSVPMGEFVTGNIDVKNHVHILAIPRQSVLIREGKTYAIQVKMDGKEGKPTFTPVLIETGISSTEFTEVKNGIHPGDSIVSNGALGFLYPDFKESVGD